MQARNAHFRPILALACGLSLGLASACGAHAAAYALQQAATTVRLGVQVFPGHVFDGRVSDFRGDVQLDHRAKTGRLYVTLRAASLDLGNALATELAQSAQFLDAKRFDSIEFTGTRFDFQGEQPVAVSGMVRIRGRSMPLRLSILGFRCSRGPAADSDTCTADLQGSLDTSALGFSGPLAGVVQALRLSIHATVSGGDR